MLKVKIDFYPKDYCYKCMFCRVDDYGESHCMLSGLKLIDNPDWDRPEWCPFCDAEEVEECT